MAGLSPLLSPRRAIRLVIWKQIDRLTNRDRVTLFGLFFMVGFVGTVAVLRLTWALVS